MKYETRNTKYEKRKARPAKLRWSGGMTLFIAVTIMAILLFISFAVVNISIKSSVFATSGRDSQFAFYAADAGVECALYWDAAFEPSKFDPDSGGSDINCADNVIHNGNTIVGTTTTVAIGGGGTVYSPIVLNNACGGVWGPDAEGLNWSADAGYSGGNCYSVADEIANTSDDALYQSERWSFPKVTYNFNVPNGNFLVILKFAEIYFGPGRPGGGGTGSRVFNIKINGVTVETNFDIFATAGGALRAIDKQYVVNVTGSNILIELESVVSNPKISAIRIDSQTGGGSSNRNSVFGFVMNGGANQVPHCAIVSVTKNLDGSTYIKSRGYNTCDVNDPRRIERGVEVLY